MEGIWRLSETRVGIELLGQLKTRAESGLPVKRKIQKTTRKNRFSGNRFFRVIFWIFLLNGKSD